MPESTEDKTTRRIRPPIVLIIFALMIGLLGFYRVADNPHFASYRTVDVVQLMASGAAIGVAFMALMLRILRPRFDTAT
jgi:hypothetical protein